MNTIIFDLGKVLVDFIWEKTMTEFNFDEEKYKKIADSFYLGSLREEYDRSLLSDEEIIDMFTKDFPQYKKDFEKVFYNEGKAVEVFDYTEEWIDELKSRGMKIYILSNYARNTYMLTKDRLKFLEKVDGALFSWQIKKIKPEREIYEALINKYKLVSSDCIFIDDKQKNLDMAQSLGITTILFDNKESVDEKLKSMLTVK